MPTATPIPSAGLSRATGSSAAALIAVLIGLFVTTLDALIVSVALPSIRHDLGGGITGQQWVVAGYTLVLAALLLSRRYDRGPNRCPAGTRMGPGPLPGRLRRLRCRSGNRPSSSKDFSNRLKPSRVAPLLFATRSQSPAAGG